MFEVYSELNLLTPLSDRYAFTMSSGFVAQFVSFTEVSFKRSVLDVVKNRGWPGIDLSYEMPGDYISRFICDFGGKRNH